MSVRAVPREIFIVHVGTENKYYSSREELVKTAASVWSFFRDERYGKRVAIYRFGAEDGTNGVDLRDSLKRIIEEVNFDGRGSTAEARREKREEIIRRFSEAMDPQ